MNHREISRNKQKQTTRDRNSLYQGTSILYAFFYLQVFTFTKYYQHTSGYSFNGLPKKRQEVSRSDKKCQEASRGFYKHYNAFLCMLHSKIDHMVHVQVFFLFK